jgi:hypothetical protein
MLWRAVHWWSVLSPSVVHRIAWRSRREGLDGLIRRKRTEGPADETPGIADVCTDRRIGFGVSVQERDRRMEVVRLGLRMHGLPRSRRAGGRVGEGRQKRSKGLLTPC